MIVRPIRKAFRYVHLPLIILDYAYNLHYFDSNFNYIYSEEKGGLLDHKYNFPQPSIKDILEMTKEQVVIKLPVLSFGYSVNYRMILRDSNNRLHFFDENFMYKGSDKKDKFVFEKPFLN